MSSKRPSQDGVAKQPPLKRAKSLRARLEVVNAVENQNIPDILLDLETSGKSKTRDEEITELAAMTRDGKHKYDVFILPMHSIAPSATHLTGFNITTLDGTRRLTVDGNIVETVTLEEALSGLITFLKEQGSKINLVGQNILIFDYRILYKALVKTGMLDQFESVVNSFTETIHVFKDAYPDRTTYGQEALVKAILPPSFTYKAHRALEDVEALRELLKGVEANCFLDNTYTYDSVKATLK